MINEASLLKLEYALETKISESEFDLGIFSDGDHESLDAKSICGDLACALGWSLKDALKY